MVQLKKCFFFFLLFLKDFRSADGVHKTRTNGQHVNIAAGHDDKPLFQIRFDPPLKICIFGITHASHRLLTVGSMLIGEQRLRS